LTVKKKKFVNVTERVERLFDLYVKMAPKDQEEASEDDDELELFV
jgi:hypothetical protein